MKPPKRQPELDTGIVNLLKLYGENDPDFEYWFIIASTKIQYFIRRYESSDNKLEKMSIIQQIMVYLIEKWERHMRFLNEQPQLLEDIKECFKRQRNAK